MADGVATPTRHGALILRAYRPGDEEGILALFQRVSGQKRSLAHWRWKFQDNPGGQQIMLAVTESGEVVGQAAGLPAWADKGGRRFLISHGADHMVDPRFRRGLKKPGLQVMLVKRFFETFMGPDKGALAYGIPIPVYCRLLVRMGVFMVLHRVMQLEKELSRDEGAPRGRLPCWRYRVEEVPRFPETVDELWQRCQRELPLAIIRDARYLNWRYSDCPDVTYAKLLATDRWTGRVSGIAVLRLGVGEQPVVLLVDWLVPGRHRRLAEVLLQHCHALGAATGQSLIEAWFPEYAPQFELLVAQGYRSTPTQYENVVQPFHPELTLEWLQGHWYYTMGDSDIC